MPAAASTTPTPTTGSRTRTGLPAWQSGGMPVGLLGPVGVEAAAAEVVATAAARLEELRLGAVEDRVEAELALGTDPAVVIADLDTLTAAYPLRERAWALLVTALHRAGRGAEALASFDRCRK